MEYKIGATMSQFKKIILSVFLLNLVSVYPTFGDTKSESWVDVNYALCEGVGATASGRIKGTVDYEFSGNTIKISSLELETIGYQHNHQPSGSITYVMPNGEKARVSLQLPWFSVLRAAGPGSSLLLPRNKTSASGPSAAEQIEIVIKKGTPIEISVALLFSVPGGNCPTSFSTSWIVE